MHYPRNLETFPQTGVGLIKALAKQGISTGHFTNGTYASPQALIVPTVLAGFQYAVDQEANKGSPLIIAVNSNASMSGIMDKKGAPETETHRSAAP